MSGRCLQAQGCEVDVNPHGRYCRKRRLCPAHLKVRVEPAAKKDPRVDPAASSTLLGPQVAAAASHDDSIRIAATTAAQPAQRLPSASPCGKHLH